MACRISELVLGCRDPEVLARFWCEVLDFVVLDRLLKLGARPADIGQTGQEQWHVLADPEGNEFCLLKARLNPL
ncbi:hypothetical protein CDO52_17115 [Nocardiopsis gilva YIM 90087]|uniref:Glyoxalase-like domain-containing protein n=1 Tax=Nocardiopsis gilva YIM 90087 TaxID=1235441 RepID=A0A223S849_9ACTN|nr:VOC family protein [Nocardiopsis gilva]ASU84286.1 hypothetical protein CDO52_17115 [Nocardiopsis gilva YIM 90087]